MPSRALLLLLLAFQFPLALGALAAPCGPLPPGTPAITPATRADERGQRLAERSLAVLEARPSPTLLVGDSILAFWRTAAADLGGPVTNFAVGGDRTEHVLDRIDRAALSPDAFRRVVLLIGTNNLTRDDACAVLGGINAVVERLRQRLPRAEILVVSVLPRGPGLAVRRREIEAVNRALAEGQAGLGYHFVDAFTPFAQACDGVQDCPLLPDRLHPGPEGYALLGRSIAPALGAP